MQEQLTTTAIDWLEARGIDHETAQRYGVESFHRQQGEGIKVNFMVHDETVNAKYRLLDEKRFWMDAGAQVVVWNFNTLLDKGLANHVPLIITEGELDAISAIQAGFPHTISVPNGAPSGDSDDGARYEWLNQIIDMITHKEIILATDNDGPGHRLRRDLEIRLGVARCRWVRYPEDCKDLNEVLQAYGSAKVAEVISQAPWVQLRGLYSLDDLPPEPEKEIIRTGFEVLDPHFKIRRGEFMVLSGTPGSGKTEWVSDLCCRVASNHGWKIAVGSFEENVRANLAKRLKRWHRGKPGDDPKATQWVRDHFSFIVPTVDCEADLFWLLDRMKAAVIRYGVRMIVVDPWNEIEHDKPRDLSMTEYTGQAIRALKKFAQNYDVFVVVVAHPTKSVRENDQVMSLYDIADSAHWANKPDVGAVVYRQDGLTGFYVRKVRFQQDIGKPGNVWFSFNSYSGRFEAAPEPDEIKRK